MILIGEAAPLLRKAWEGVATLTEASTLRDAVDCAAQGHRRVTSCCYPRLVPASTCLRTIKTVAVNSRHWYMPYRRDVQSGEGRF